MSYNTTIKHALEAKDVGKLCDWTLNFLENEGGNKNLAYEIRKRPQAKATLLVYPLKDLKRVMGPEDTMMWKEDEKIWRARVDAIKNHLGHKKAEVPPLIATNFWGEARLSDGNHRHQALLEVGLHEYWVIFFRD